MRAASPSNSGDNVNDQAMTYDHESRVKSVTRNGATVNYVYNGLDTRTSVTMGNTTNSFLRDGAYVTDPVLVDSGAVYTPGISERRGTKTTYLHSGLKNAFAQSDTSQSVAATREYDAFGNVTSHTGAWEGPFGYAGKFGYQSASIPGTSTPDAVLQLLGHRYYDPSTGRFLTRDPIFDGRNWYSYGGGEGNLLTGADPTGLAWHDPAQVHLHPDFKGKVIAYGEPKEQSGDGWIAVTLTPGHSTHPDMDFDLIFVIPEQGDPYWLFLPGADVPGGPTIDSGYFIHPDGIVTEGTKHPGRFPVPPFVVGGCPGGHILKCAHFGGLYWHHTWDKWIEDSKKEKPSTKYRPHPNGHVWR